MPMRLGDPRLALVGQKSRGEAVDLWLFFYEAPLREPALERRYEQLLAPEERSRYRRFVCTRAKRMYLATRALVRTTLSHYADVSPAAWRFASGPYGKPRIHRPRVPSLWFNLSNTEGLVVCAVSTKDECLGVDTENVARDVAVMDLAERSFSRTEFSQMCRMPCHRRKARFFAYWTLKESYIKARGMGLQIPIDEFSFVLDGGPIRICILPRLHDDPARWQFALVRPSACHLVAVALGASSPPLSLRTRESTPLVRTGPVRVTARVI